MRPHDRLGAATSITAFATDFFDEGIDHALDNIQVRGGIDGVSLAAVYHHGRDIFPHSPVRRVRFLEGGRAFFNPDGARYNPGGLRPVPSSFFPDWDPLAELRRTTEARGMSLHAWTVFTHNTLLGSQHLDAVVENVYGDPQPTALCPANPAVVAYCRGLALDIARYEVESILAESLHYDVLEHGYHHERYLIDIGPIDRILLGLCFCRHCRECGKHSGVDVAGLADAVRTRLDRLFRFASAYDASEADLETMDQLWGGELLAYLRARAGAVTDLASQLAGSLAGSGTTLAFIDPAGALKGYADGKPTGAPSTTASWRFGVDPRTLSTVCDELVVVAYAIDPERVRSDLESYLTLTAGRCGLRVALRPMPPDCPGPENLSAKLAVVADCDVSRVDFYHYGFMRLEVLDVVNASLDEARVR